MAAHPVRAHKAEAALEGRPLDKETIAAAAAVLADQTSPADDPYATGWYRREIAPVHFSRLLSA
jgi:CO/xanthine dehydrogenase FAD-binding subunit